jgi:hypothetical protein
VRNRVHCSAFFTNSHISNNDAKLLGGGIYDDGDALQFMGTVINDNVAAFQGDRKSGSNIYMANGGTAQFSDDSGSPVSGPTGVVCADQHGHIISCPSGLLP